MAERLGILACAGKLPVQIAAAHPEAFVVTLKGIPSELEPQSQQHRLEKIGKLFTDLKKNGVTRIVFAGSLARPQFRFPAMDMKMISLAPRVIKALPKGDDALLRTVIAVFEEEGFAVVGAHELLPELVAEEGLSVGPKPGKNDLQDVSRAEDILKGISPLDIGQGCVVAGGQCLGIETAQGTDALLKFVALAPDKLRRGHKGVFVKAAKQGQDLRIDMPTIGTNTIDAVAAAGLGGIVIEAGRVMLLEREATLAAVKDKGLYLVAKAM